MRRDRRIWISTISIGFRESGRAYQPCLCMRRGGAATECRELLEEPDSVRRARRRRFGKRANITGLPRALRLIPERREARHLKANRTTSVIHGSGRRESDSGRRAYRAVRVRAYRGDPAERSFGRQWCFGWGSRSARCPGRSASRAGLPAEHRDVARAGKGARRCLGRGRALAGCRRCVRRSSWSCCQPRMAGAARRSPRRTS